MQNPDSLTPPWMTRPMRVLIEGLPRLLNDVVVSIVSGEPDIDFEQCSREDVARRIREGAVDAVITIATPSLVVSLLQSNPALRVIAVAEGARTGFLWQMRPYRESLGELSADGLIRALRRPLQGLSNAETEPTPDPVTGRGDE
jgi:hypothetical protein